MRRYTAAALLMVLAVASISLAEDTKSRPVALVFSAQEQGALFSCVCPLNPQGGFAKKATLINSLRKRYDLSVINAGGWMPGGILDEMSGGRDEQVSRASVIAKTLDFAKTDVISIAQDDLALGADVLKKTAQSPAAKFITGNTPLGGLAGAKVRGVYYFSVANENLMTPLYKSMGMTSIVNPAEFAKNQIAEAKASGAERVVMLSSMSERDTVKLVLELEGVDLVFLSNRERPGRKHYRIRGVQFASVEPQGRELGLWIPNQGYSTISVDATLDDDQDAVKFLSGHGYASSGLQKVTLDFYTMSRCPYGRPATTAVLDAWSAIADKVKLNLYFVVSIDKDDKLRSLHGEDELEDNRRMLAIWLYKPAALLKYLTESAIENFNFAKWLAANSIDPFRIKASLDSGEIDAELKLHAARCRLTGIEASPTLMISNAPFEGNYTRDEVLFGICRRLQSAANIDACKSLPKCYSDADCAQTGMISICENPGTKDAKCRSFRDIEVRATAIRATNHISDPYNAAVIGMKNLMPGLVVKDIDASSQTGRTFINQYNIAWLPAFIFEPEIRKAYRFKAISGSLTELKDGRFLAQPASVNANFKCDRAITKGSELFVSPHSPQSVELLKALCTKGNISRSITIRFVVFKGLDGRQFCAGGVAELEECERLAAAFLVFPDKALKYLSAICENPGSSYWDDAAIKAGIEPNILKKEARSEKVRARLVEDAQVCAAFGFGGSDFLLVDNRELVIVKDPFDLEVMNWICAEPQR